MKLAAGLRKCFDGSILRSQQSALCATSSGNITTTMSFPCIWQDDAATSRLNQAFN